MMFDQMVNFGIDLGTTNSVASVFCNGEVTEVRLPSTQTSILPSAVCIYSRRGKDEVRELVGRAAREQLSSRVDDVHVEFKRQMGTATELKFQSSGVTKSPEELSAMVLMKLREAAMQQYGEKPHAAVITIPAMFGQPERDATARAAELAGFRQSFLLQEPIAAAICHGFTVEQSDGYWLIFDFGGGTFDASIVSVRDGEMIVVKHAGDSSLGGSDLDDQIVREKITPDIREENDLTENDFGPSHDKWRQKGLAEALKIALSSSDPAEILGDEEGAFKIGTEELDVPDFEWTRSELAACIKGLIDNAVTITQKLISDCEIRPDQIDKLIPVGGVTYIPYVRERLQSLGIEVDFGMDPMTSVSRGAAIFAANQRVSDEISQDRVVADDVVRAKLEYDATTMEEFPEVAGSLELAGQRLKEGWSVEIQSTDGHYSSGKLPVSAQGLFLTDLNMKGSHHSREFHLSVTGPSGESYKCDPSSFYISTGLGLGKAPLPAGLGVGLVDGTVATLIPGGTLYPCTSEPQIRHLSADLIAGSEGVFCVPVVSGDEPLVEANITAAHIRIEAKALVTSVTKGSEVEVKCELSEDGVSTVHFFFPTIDQSFSFRSVAFIREHESASEFRSRFTGYCAKLEDLQSRSPASTRGDIAAFLESSVIDELDMLIAEYEGGDERVNQGRIESLLTQVFQKTQAYEHHLTQSVEWPKKLQRFETEFLMAERVVQEFGTSSEKSEWDKFSARCKSVKDSQDVEALQECISETRSWWFRMKDRDPEFLRRQLNDLKTQVSNMEPGFDADSVLEEGYQALSDGDLRVVKNCINRLRNNIQRDSGPDSDSDALTQNEVGLE